MINSFTFILGGSDSVDQMDHGLTSTFYYDIASESWTDGPEMIQARSAFGCGSFLSEFHDGKRIIAAIGKTPQYLKN